VVRQQIKEVRWRIRDQSPAVISFSKKKEL
jgi:hypothetical protein